MEITQQHSFIAAAFITAFAASASVCAGESEEALAKATQNVWPVQPLNGRTIHATN